MRANVLIELSRDDRVALLSETDVALTCLRLEACVVDDVRDQIGQIDALYACAIGARFRAQGSDRPAASGGHEDEAICSSPTATTLERSLGLLRLSNGPYGAITRSISAKIDRMHVR